MPIFTRHHLLRTGALLMLCGLLILLVACLPGDGRGRAQDQAERSGFTPLRFSTPEFVVLGWLRPTHATAPAQVRTLHVYIEGDGLAWRSRSQPSRDPTPTTPVAFKLAAADPTPDPVLYLARPCQYTRDEDRRGCSTSDWTSHRFAPRTMAAMNSAIDQALVRAGAQQVAVYGFSGGGGIAALLAEERKDVVFLATIAGNLDHRAWTTHHKITPLSGSLNPQDRVQATARIPQLHVSGSADEVVPSFMADAWCAQLPTTPCQRRNLPGMQHEGAWEHYWPALVRDARPSLSQ